jgi:protein-disulfide isomerase
MTRAGFAPFLIAVALAACSAPTSPGPEGAVTSAQRTQVVQIVRDALKKDPTILREAILALQADNARVEAEAVRTTIARQHGALFDPRDPTGGNLRGNVVIAEFFDPQCPYCRQLAPKLTRFLAKDRDVRLVYKDLPILGPASELGSRALLAAQRQAAYERMRDAIMRDPREITLESVRQTATKLGLNWHQMLHDIDDSAIARKLAANEHLAKALGIDGTPTFVIDGKVIAGADMTQIAGAVVAARRGGSPKGSKPGS